MFEISLVSPEALVFMGKADQVDLPGADGDLGILAGHAPILVTLRPGLVEVIANDRRERFVVLGGIAEFSQSNLNILADAAKPVAEFDLTDLKVRIEQIERRVSMRSMGDELDREIRLLDHYRTLRQNITVTTAL